MAQKILEIKMTRPKEKILYLDLETSLNIVVTFHIGNKVSIRPEQIIKERAIICASYMFEGEDKPKTIYWDKNQDDCSLLERLIKVINKADVLVYHNGDKFDLPYINGRLLYHDLDPIGPTCSIDTLKQSRGTFYLNSHRLDYLGKYCKLGRKVNNGGLQRWIDVSVYNNRSELRKMGYYCEGDVLLLQDFYKRASRYAKQRHHIGVMRGGNREDCPSCGNVGNVKWGTYTSAIGRYQRYKCNKCFHVWKDGRMIK